MNLKTVIGIEMHTALNTKTKIFSNSLNTYSNTPNMAVSNIDLAHPGTLPYLNKETVYKAITMALSLNCEVADTLIFDRKCYFYPDLAKGYQITQDTLPIGLSGNLDIEVGNRLVNIKIADIHLEEDTASLDHFNDYSLLDFNRAGTPLLEIVTEPCISSADEAVAFLEQVRNIYKYTGVSNADTKKGEVRCDLNISMHEEGSSTFGTRVEIKNVNSFSNVRDAINYEIKRQSDLIKSGNKEKIIKETRRWDEEKEMTVCMREKSDALDYRFHVDPNIPKIKIDNDLIENIKKTIPELPLARKEKYINDYDLSAYDAGVLIKDKDISDYFEKCLTLGIDPKEASNWITSELMGYLNKENIEISDCYLTPERLFIILNNLNNKTINSKQAKDLFNLVLEEEREPIDLIIKYNMKQIDNKDELEIIIKEILNNNENQVKEYKEGKTNLFDYFVGQTMKETKGKANPELVKEILLQLLK